MNIEIEIPDESLNKIKETLISNMNLDTDISDRKLNENLNSLAKTAFYEYLEMITESGIPKRVSDVLQNRILLLIENYYLRFPNENELARIFNIPTSRSRSVLNNLKATHRNKLKHQLKEKIVEFIQKGIKEEHNGEKWVFEVTSKPIVHELNELISLRRPGLAKFKQKTGSAAKVTLPVDSYDFLKAEYGIQ